MTNRKVTATKLTEDYIRRCRQICGLPEKKESKKGPSELTQIFLAGQITEKIVFQHQCADWFYVNLAQATVIREEGASSENLPSEDHTVGKPVGHFLSDWCGNVQPTSYAVCQFAMLLQAQLSSGLHQTRQHLSCHRLPLIAFLGSLVSWQLGCTSAVLDVPCDWDLRVLEGIPLGEIFGK
ncbi:hypothetical protein U0070_015456 [Myodes glareolus]|uniref:Uncharacterized protein n=1 Tax=Myodes glareolus TaxID=447135 RepID=A0AAW0H6K9_MYOGA